MYHSSNQLITKYTDYIQQNPDYIKKVINETNFQIFNMEILDSTNFIIDTIKYTELYPRRHSHSNNSVHNSSGFNSSKSSTTESILRKNLVEYEHERQQQKKIISNSEIISLDKTKIELVDNFQKLNNDNDNSQKLNESCYQPNYSNEDKDDGFYNSDTFEEESPSSSDVEVGVEVVRELEKVELQNDKHFGVVQGVDLGPPLLLQSLKSDNKTGKIEDVGVGSVELKTYSKDSDPYFKNEFLFNKTFTPRKYTPEFVQPLVNNTFKQVRKSPSPPFAITFPEAEAKTIVNFEKNQIEIQNNSNPVSFDLSQNLEKIPNPNQTFFTKTQTHHVSNVLKNHNNITPPNNLKQVVRYPTILPTWSPPPQEIQRKIGQIPRILRRYNMDQWVAKIIWLYTNGNERLQRVEYRFRPEKDVRSFDGLCDILSRRLGLTRGVRYIYSLNGRPILSLDELRHGDSYVVSSTKKFKALNYGGEIINQDNNNSNKKLLPIHPITSSMKQPLPPIIRIRKDKILRRINSASKSRSISPPSQQQHQQQQYMSMSSIDDIKKNTSSSITTGTGTGPTEAEKLVNAVIGETHPVQRKIVRIINGENPSIQSQVLLNTRVSQEWEDLVKDLSAAIKFPKMFKSHMETLVGRKILSYSQLRAELNAGNQTFYIYKNDEKINLKNSKTNSHNLEYLRNMKNLSLQDTRKEIKMMNGNNFPHPPYPSHMIKKSKSLIPIINKKNHSNTT